MKEKEACVTKLLTFLLLAETLLLVPNPKEYNWISQGVTSVENMDDGEELLITDVSEWVWLGKDKDNQDGNFGGLHVLPSELGWRSP